MQQPPPNDPFRQPMRVDTRDYAGEAKRSGGYKKIGVGVLMVVGAIVWFVGGLAIDRIFFYPPILGFLGILSIAKGAVDVSTSRSG